jgi:hypothetical protein
VLSINQYFVADVFVNKLCKCTRGCDRIDHYTLCNTQKAWRSWTSRGRERGEAGDQIKTHNRRRTHKISSQVDKSSPSSSLHISNISISLKIEPDIPVCSSKMQVQSVCIADWAGNMYAYSQPPSDRHCRARSSNDIKCHEVTQHN